MPPISCWLSCPALDKGVIFDFSGISSFSVSPSLQLWKSRQRPAQGPFSQSRWLPDSSLPSVSPPWDSEVTVVLRPPLASLSLHDLPETREAPRDVNTQAPDLAGEVGVSQHLRARLSSLAARLALAPGLGMSL